MAAGDERLGQVRADESGATGHEGMAAVGRRCLLAHDRVLQSPPAGKTEFAGHDKLGVVEREAARQILGRAAAWMGAARAGGGIGLPGADIAQQLLSLLAEVLETGLGGELPGHTTLLARIASLSAGRRRGHYAWKARGRVGPFTRTVGSPRGACTKATNAGGPWQAVSGDDGTGGPVGICVLCHYLGRLASSR